MTEKRFILFIYAIIILAVGWVFIVAQGMIDGKGTKGYTMVSFSSGSSKASADSLMVAVSNQTDITQHYGIEYEIDGIIVATTQTDVSSRSTVTVNPPDELMEALDRLPVQSAMVRITFVAGKQKEQLHKVITTE